MESTVLLVYARTIDMLGTKSSHDTKTVVYLLCNA